MEWTKADDAALFGDGAEDARRDASMLREMGVWPEAHAMRSVTGDGLVAWLWVSKAGTLSTLCVCDDGGGFDGRDYVPMSELFAASWPKGWITKRKAAGVAQDACTVGGFACGTMGREALLCRVVALDAAGAPSIVQPRIGAPEMAIAELGERKWFGMTKWPMGIAELWARGWTKGDYRNMCRWAGVFEKAAKTKADRAAKRAKASKD